MTETNQEINDYSGESAIPCSAKSVMEWREKYRKTLKLDIIEFFGKALGYGRELTDYWLRSEKKTYEADAFFAGCKEAYAAELYGAIWLSILEDWFKEDWRGQKAQKPTPSQLFEHGLKWRYAELEKTKNLSMRKPQFIRREAAAFSQQVYRNGKWQDEH